MQITDPVTLELFEKVRQQEQWNWLYEYAPEMYFAAFGLAALVALSAVLLRPLAAGETAAGLGGRLRGLRTRLLCGGIMVQLGLLAVSQQTAIDTRRGFITDQDRQHQKLQRAMAKAGKTKDDILRSDYLYLPEGKSLVFMSLGNEGIAADFLWLTSLQYVATSFRRGQKFELLSRFYEAMNELDPQWEEAAVNAGRVLSALERDRYKVEAFYIKAVGRDPDNWRLRFEAGSLFIMMPGDEETKKEYAKRGAFWFQQATETLNRLPPTPERHAQLSNIKLLASRMELDSGRLDVADQLFYESATDPERPQALRYAAQQEWLTARSELLVHLLQEQVNAYQAQNGIYPQNLEGAFEALKNDRRVSRADPYGFKIEYEARTGQVFSRGQAARNTVQANAIIDSFIYEFTMERGRPPASLDELQQYVTDYYTPPREAAPFSVTSAIGQDLNVRISPLREPWGYNPATGQLKVPDYVKPEMVLQSVMRHFPNQQP